jgi:hypothetical protein
MTESEWLECNGPMLEFLKGKASDRKLRLFACACCRRVWNSLWSGRLGQEAILTAERFADAKATLEELDACRALVQGQLELHPGEPVFDPTYWACSKDIQEDAERSSGYALNTFAIWQTRNVDDSQAQFDKRREEEASVQALLLHDLFGPLLFRSVPLSHEWFTWNDATIPKMAHIIYNDRAFDHMPILADALEEAGCTNADILAHCRGPGPHTKGCWVIDFILGNA